ncbi:MAG: methyltransferase domain-containing protein [Chloroflexi bacterium]|nr:methyltransferase domain-containing protein [Chloroflexota bacterium]
MTCCHQCRGIEAEFNPKLVRREIDQYRRQGPRGTTRLLIAALIAEGVAGLTLLDIGGGVGAVQHALLAAGATRAAAVEAASAYAAAARAEAEWRGLTDRVTLMQGDFITLAPSVAPADIVTLDRVICCYPDMPALVGLSAARARRLYGVVYPRDAWWTRLGLALINTFYRLRRSPFRVFAHPSAAVEERLRAHGLTRRYHRTTAIWQVAVYARA